VHVSGKTIIVTGAGRGIGRGIALKLAREGANVVIAEMNESDGQSVAKEIADESGRALFLKVDITDRVQVDLMVDKVVSEFDVIDGLVNNAGWDKIENFIDSEEATWEKVLAINLLGPIRCCQAVLKHMIPRKHGKIVNIGSDAGRVGSSGEAVYSAAKGGVISFTKTLAREIARYQINVNCICPGPSDTPLFAEIIGDNPKIGEALVKSIPLRRLGKPEDIANAIMFLISNEAQFVTGQTLSVSGGLTMV